jgi:hypothetical protein
MTDLTPEALDELERLEREATSAPWEVYCDLNLKAPDDRSGKLCPLLPLLLTKGHDQ